jgi:uncharacterized protein (TIGR03083 family)
MTTEPREVIAVLRASHEQLTSLVRPLDADGIRSQSYDADWSIAQVLSHLGSQNEMFGMFLNAAITHTDPPGNDQLPPIWAAWNERSPEEQVADSLALSEQFLGRLEGLPDDELDSLQLSLFGMDLDAAGLVRLQMGEHALHTWDVAVALDPDATVSAAAVEQIVDTVANFVPRLGKPLGRPLTLAVHTVGPERDWTLTIGDESVELVSGKASAPDGSLHLPAEAFIRLVYGRLDDAHEPGSVQLEADDVSLDDLRAVFPGV